MTSTQIYFEAMIFSITKTFSYSKQTG